MRVIAKTLPGGGTEYCIGHNRAFHIIPNGEWLHLFSYVGNCTLPVWSMRRRGPKARTKCIAFVQDMIDGLA